MPRCLSRMRRCAFFAALSSVRGLRSAADSKLAALEAARDRGAKTPAIVLARPFVDGNIGAVCRAMANFGLHELRVAAPQRSTWRDAPETAARCAGSLPILERACEFATVEAATADLQLVIAATARTRENSMLRQYTAEEAARMLVDASRNGLRCGLLFGSERDGLSSHELLSAHAIVTIPTDPLFSSLNLAQAALLCCYEWRRADTATGDARAAPSSEPLSTKTATTTKPANGARIESFLAFAAEALQRNGFFGGDDAHVGDRAASGMVKLRRLLMRASPTNDEISRLRGACNALLDSDPKSNHTPRAKPNARSTRSE